MGFRWVPGRPGLESYQAGFGPWPYASHPWVDREYIVVETEGEVHADKDYKPITVA